MLSDKIRLISGPGCPVCVTVAEYIDVLVDYSRQENTVVVSFGDMLRVPGSKECLKDAMASGGKVKMVYSPLEMLDMAEKDKLTTYIFAAVGFETTTPIYAVLIEEAIKRNLTNIKLLTALKTMPKAIEFLCENGSKIDGFLALAKLVGRGEVRNLYKRAVSENGNETARKSVLKYFEPCDAVWRGIGLLKGSGMALKPEYASFDAGSRGIIKDTKINPACHCSEVIIGKTSPTKCSLFGKICTPENPQGACMVSTEGSCYSYYVNDRKDF